MLEFFGAFFFPLKFSTFRTFLAENSGIFMIVLEVCQALPALEWVITSPASHTEGCIVVVIP